MFSKFLGTKTPKRERSDPKSNTNVEDKLKRESEQCLGVMH
jgi:hypothetical protein